MIVAIRAPMRHGALVVVLSAGAASPALAQWSAVSLHPPGAISSRANGTTATQQVGEVEAFNPVTLSIETHAVLWNGVSSWVDLHPAGASRSSAEGIAAANRAGRRSLVVGRQASGGDPPRVGATFTRVHRRSVQPRMAPREACKRALCTGPVPNTTMPAPGVGARQSAPTSLPRYGSVGGIRRGRA
jgi:hypothetical protein